MFVKHHLVFLICGSLLLTACGGSGENNEIVPDPAVSYDKYAVKLQTTQGEIYIWPDVSNPDVGLLSFQRQVVHGIYDNTLFHRIIPDFLIQGGEFDPNFNPVLPVGNMEISTINPNNNHNTTVALTKSATNNSTGFFFNLDNNYHLDFNRNVGYEVVGKLDNAFRTTETLKSMLAITRVYNTFDGPSTAFIPTTKIHFAGNLSTGNTQTTIDNVIVYDANGEPRRLTINFVNNRFTVPRQWFVTVTDEFGVINQTYTLNFEASGQIVAGSNSHNLVNPAVTAGQDTNIELYFGDPSVGFGAVTNYSGGTTSSISIFELNGRPIPDNLEQPEQNIIIQKAVLLGRDRTLPKPNQTTEIHLTGNLVPEQTGSVSHEFEFYILSPVVSGLDQAGIESRMTVVFTNYNYIQTGQWLIEIFWEGVKWGSSYALQFDSNGNLIGSTDTIYLNSRQMFPIKVFIDAIRSSSTASPSVITVKNMDGNSRWNQYLPITADRFEELVLEAGGPL